MVIEQKELAEVLGITPRRVRQLTEEGVLQKAEGGRGYPLERNTRAYLDFKTEAEVKKRVFNDERSARLNREEIQAQHERVKMEISKMQLKRMKGELYTVANVEEFLNTKFARFKQNIMDLPAKIVFSTAGQSPEQAKETITAYIEDALKELTSYDPADFNFKNPYYDMDAGDDETDAEGVEE